MELWSCSFVIKAAKMRPDNARERRWNFFGWLFCWSLCKEARSKPNRQTRMPLGQGCQGPITIGSLATTMSVTLPRVFPSGSLPHYHTKLESPARVSIPRKAVSFDLWIPRHRERDDQSSNYARNCAFAKITTLRDDVQWQQPIRVRVSFFVPFKLFNFQRIPIHIFFSIFSKFKI